MHAVPAPGPCDESSCSEADLVERARTDPEAFGLLYERHYQRILNYLYRRTLDVTVAEELTSNTFFQALDGLPRYRYRAPFRAWLYRIATTEISMYWRSRRRRRALQEGARWEAELGRVHFEPPEVEAEEELREKMRQYARLHESLKALPEKYQTVLVLRYFEGLPIGEVAQVVGKRTGTVRSLIHRGRKKLRRLMGKKGATFP